MSFCVFMIPFLLSSALLKEVKMLMFTLVMNILKDKNTWLCHSLSHDITDWFWNTQRHPGPLRHLIGVMRKHSLAKKRVVKDKDNDVCIKRTPWKSHLWDFFTFWTFAQSTSNDNPIEVVKLLTTLKSDTGQHSQSLQCFHVELR